MLNLKKVFYIKPSFIYHLGSKTYKIFTPKGRYFRLAELQGNRTATLTEFWRDQVVEVTPSLICLEMLRGKPLTADDKQQADAYIEYKLHQALAFKKDRISKAYDFSILKELSKFGLDKNLIDRSEEILSNVYLPITSAHGDFHSDNMIVIGHDLKIIDWSMFAKQGSFITDYIHFHNYRFAKANRESWTRSILKERKYINCLAKVLAIRPNDLRLAYSISRISGEIRQREDLNLVTSNEILKYNYVLTHLLNESAEATFLHNNSALQ
jgi:hypothetical protein